MPSSYQVVLWKQESFVVLRSLQVEFFRNLLEPPAVWRLQSNCKSLTNCFAVRGRREEPVI
jgi:hypothetical protein